MADEKLTEAFQIEHKGNLSKQDSKNKFEPLYDSVDALKKAIGTSSFKGKWAKIKKSISTFKNKIVHP